MSRPEKIYKSLVLEIRPRLRSVNVLISLVSSVENVKISLNSDSFQIIVGEHTCNVCCKNLKIVSDSLSSLSVTESYVSFRFATDNSLDDWGSFKTELLRTSESVSFALSKSTFLLKSQLYTIQCKNCSQDLSESLRFGRVLPLPSEHSEPGDWFCHGHGSNSVALLDPKESDIFYTSCYCHLNKRSTRNVLESDKLIVCKRCLSWLGVAKNPETAKFWFNTVAFKDESKVHTSCALRDALDTVHETLCGVLFTTAKIILCCQSSKSQTDYILLWILEKQLNVQIYNSDSEGVVEDCKVAKVLFKYESGGGEIVKKWLEDSSVASVDVSKPMTVEILKHLYKFNKIFPREFSESNNFYISYLMMYEHGDK
jgi:hypothetical protein